MLKQKITQALTTYAGALLWVAHYNLSISLYLKSKGYDKLSTHIRSLYQKHLSHSVEIYDYIAKHGTIAQISDMVDIPVTFDTPDGAVERSLVQTLRLTDALESLMDILLQSKDYTTYVTFQYLLREQFEEEVLLSKLIDVSKNRY
ncbi:MAG: hypothetical protein IJA09_02880 [Bacteroidales bacterium]|nr:hypothetical protein [Bacteroidales bacterium]